MSDFILNDFDQKIHRPSSFFRLIEHDKALAEQSKSSDQNFLNITTSIV